MNYHYFSPQPFYFNTPSTYAPFPAVAPPSTNIPSSSSLNYALLVVGIHLLAHRHPIFLSMLRRSILIGMAVLHRFPDMCPPHPSYQ